jgi:ring-1,2-phenylacetyl-CoA epoxidase subunit PaaD
VKRQPRALSPELRVDRNGVLAVLDTVNDPEVPVLSVVELGIVRDVEISGTDVTVVVTPTYSGCPAMKVIEDDILAALNDAGIQGARIKTIYSPAWTTDWMSDAAREKLRAYGIAPPGRSAEQGLVTLTRPRAAVQCPFCGSLDTRHTSEFGSTSCKALHVCNDCTQPFEEFKAI